MELALKDIRRHLGKFLATIAGVAMLLAIVLVMNGIYQGNIQDGVWLIDNTATDLWVVERGRGGPFNEASRIPLDSYKSVAATPGVARASPLALYTAQREINGREPAVHGDRLRHLRRRGRPGPPRAGPRDRRAALRDGGRPQARPAARRPRARSAPTTTTWSASPAARSIRAATRWSTWRSPTRRRCSSSRTRAPSTPRGRQPAAPGPRRLFGRAGGAAAAACSPAAATPSTRCW